MIAPEDEAMPPNPWKLLKTDELTPEQRRSLLKKLKEREHNLKLAMDAVEKAVVLLSRTLDQDSQSKYVKKIRSKKKKVRR
jgi:hypothetical protein